MKASWTPREDVDPLDADAQLPGVVEAGPHGDLGRTAGIGIVAATIMGFLPPSSIEQPMSRSPQRPAICAPDRRWNR